MSRELVDTNVLVRFFTGDPPEMAEGARRLVQKADEGKAVLIVLPVILAEVFYTLESYYRIKRNLIAEKLASFIESRGIEAVEFDRLRDALRRCRNQNAHFADAYLAASAVELRTGVSSFDRDFDKFEDVHRSEP